MDKMTIAAQLYTLRDYLKTPEDIEKTFKRVKGIGYQTVQVSGLGPVDPVRLKEIAAASGLKICVTHISYDRFKNDLTGIIRDHKLWQCEYVGIGAMPQEFRTGKEGYLGFADEFNKISRKLAAEGLKFVYHNHRFEFEKFGSVTGMDILFNDTDPDTFGFLIDTYWVQAGGGNPVEWIKKVKGRMGVVHLKDMAIKNDQQVFAEIGQGNLDWVNIIKACRETGVKWYAVEQDTCPGDPFESLEKSLNYLHTLI